MEEGTHAELMTKNGAYATLVQMQQATAQSDDEEASEEEVYAPLDAAFAEVRGGCRRGGGAGGMGRVAELARAEEQQKEGQQWAQRHAWEPAAGGCASVPMGTGKELTACCRSCVPPHPLQEKGLGTPSDVAPASPRSPMSALRKSMDRRR